MVCFLVLSRRSLAAASPKNRSCQRHAKGFEPPSRRMTCVMTEPFAAARIIGARQTCFYELFRSATTAANRSWFAAPISMLIRHAWHRRHDMPRGNSVVVSYHYRGLDETISQVPLLKEGKFRPK